jgi:hypothetical protein
MDAQPPEFVETDSCLRFVVMAAWLSIVILLAVLARQPILAIIVLVVPPAFMGWVRALEKFETVPTPDGGHSCFFNLLHLFVLFLFVPAAFLRIYLLSFAH